MVRDFLVCVNESKPEYWPALVWVICCRGMCNFQQFILRLQTTYLSNIAQAVSIQNKNPSSTEKLYPLSILLLFNLSDWLVTLVFTSHRAPVQFQVSSKMMWPVLRGGLHFSGRVRQHHEAAWELPEALALNPEVRASALTGPPASEQTPSSGCQSRPCLPNSPASRWGSNPCRVWTGLSPVKQITWGSMVKTFIKSDW